jgi:hypothetical protein
MQPKSFWIETSRPRGNDPGSIETGHYVVDGNTVSLTTGSGVPLGEKYKAAVRTDESELAVAKRLLRRKMEGKRDNFWRPLTYSNRGVVA